MKRQYKAWAINDQGASVDVANGKIFPSIRKAEDEARTELGGGWHVVIQSAEWGEIVKEFTIRKDV